MGGFGSGTTALTPIVGKCRTIDIDHLTDSLASLADADRDDLAELPIPYRWSDEHSHGEEVVSVRLYPVWDGDHGFTPTLDCVNRAGRVELSMVDRRTSDSRTP